MNYISGLPEFLGVVIILIHCLTSDTDPILWPTQTTPSQGGKLVNLQEENPCSWGRKNPMGNPSRMKNPDLPCPHVAAALRAYGYALYRPPWMFELLGNHCFLQLIQSS